MLVARVAIIALLAACPSSSTTTPKPIDETPLRIRIAHAEARRADGIPELIELARGTNKGTNRGTNKSERVLALRGLGRIGGPTSLGVLVAALADPDPDVIAAAATAIGLALSLDDDMAGDPKVTKALVAALLPAKHRDVDVVEAIGRAADASAQATLVAGLAGKPEVAAASAIALGRFGRRMISLSDPARDALANLVARHPDVRVRHAAAYALAREHLPPPQVPHPSNVDTKEDMRLIRVRIQLAKAAEDSDAGVRAQAIAALTRRAWVTSAKPAVYKALYDPDWRVAVEAVRGLAGDAGDEESRRVVAVALVFWLRTAEGTRIVGTTGSEPGWVHDVLGAVKHDNTLIVTTLLLAKVGRPWREWTSTGEASGAHVVIEGLRGLASHTKDGLVGALVAAVGNYAVLSTKLAPISIAWIECLSRSAIARTAEAPAYDDVAGCRLPDHLRLPLVGALVAAKAGSVEQRRTALRPLLQHADPRVRVAGMTALAALWDDGDDADHRATVATIIAALDAKDPLVAGTAVEAATTIYEADAKKPSAEDLASAGGAEWRTMLDAAVVARANVEKDPELAGSLLDLIAKRVIASGLVACRAGLRGAPVLARASAKCMKALGQPVDKPVIGGASAPPGIDVRQVIGMQLRWKLATTRGEIVIELSPETAPWAVATIVTLTRKGFYDGLELHRVVPSFVAQGGDPTQSGWGGPGFTIPSEPSGGAGFVAGGVGVADAGRDSGGSQWFVMHGSAPHLDGRYTWIGRVVSGQKSADALQIGDAVQHATIEARDRL